MAGIAPMCLGFFRAEHFLEQEEWSSLIIPIRFTMGVRNLLLLLTCKNKELYQNYAAVMDQIWSDKQLAIQDDPNILN